MNVMKKKKHKYKEERTTESGKEPKEWQG